MIEKFLDEEQSLCYAFEYFIYHLKCLHNEKHLSLSNWSYHQGLKHFAAYEKHLAKRLAAELK